MPRWSNWYGNVHCSPCRIVTPASEEELAEEVAAAARAGAPSRVAGAGHSNVPLVCTAGTLLRLDRLAGVRTADPQARTATIGPGTPISALGDVLWEHGLALLNQGDIDSQHVAGAVSTGTHGTGIELTNFGGVLRGARLLDAEGETLVAGAASGSSGQQIELDAVRTSLGLLGVLSELTLAVGDAYCLERTWLTMSWGELCERWQELLAANRHFTFFWNPYEDSSALFGLPPAPAESVLAKMMNPLPPDAEPRGNGRHDDPAVNVERSYRIYADEYDPYFAELEYMVPVESTIAAMEDVRELMSSRHPGVRWPVEVRFTAADPGWLSPSHQRRSCVISCCGDYREDYEPFLRDVDAILAGHDARPHWGKLHFFDQPRLERAFPQLGRFRELRARVDPRGLFVNPWLRPLAGAGPDRRQA